MVNFKKSVGATVGNDTGGKKKKKLLRIGECGAKRKQTGGSFRSRLCYWYVPFQLCAQGSTNQ